MAAVSTVQSGQLAKCSFILNFKKNLLSPSCFRRGAGGDRDPGRWGKGVIANNCTVANRMISALEWAAMRDIRVLH